MPFAPLSSNLEMATWSQLVEIAPEIPPEDRPRFHAIADWYTGVAQEYLKNEVGTREELASGYGVSWRQVRRWINAFNRGGIPVLFQRRHGSGGCKRLVKPADFAESESMSRAGGHKSPHWRQAAIGRLGGAGSFARKIAVTKPRSNLLESLALPAILGSPTTTIGPGREDRNA